MTPRSLFTVALAVLGVMQILTAASYAASLIDYHLGFFHPVSSTTQSYSTHILVAVAAGLILLIGARRFATILPAEASPVEKYSGLFQVALKVIGIVQMLAAVEMATPVVNLSLGTFHLRGVTFQSGYRHIVAYSLSGIILFVAAKPIAAFFPTPFADSAASLLNVALKVLGVWQLVPALDSALTALDLTCGYFSFTSVTVASESIQAVTYLLLALFLLVCPNQLAAFFKADPRAENSNRAD